MVLRWLALVFGVTLVSALVWASDKISYEGERTIYTVQCQDGAWVGARCSGKMVAGARHRFRASKSKQEVLYWEVGSTVPSGKYPNCRVKDRGNWHCSVGANQPRTITRAMVNGRPTAGDDGPALSFHALSKWKWTALHFGVGTFNEADY